MNKIDEDFDRETSFFQKVDRIISGNTQIKVINQRCGNIAYTNMKTKEIFLSFKQIKSLITKNEEEGEGEQSNNLFSDDCFSDLALNKTRFIALCKGFNYHELSHQLNTRYTLEELQSLNNHERNTLAMIDDGRIESLFSTEYPRTSKYFTNCFTNLINTTKNENPIPETWLLAESRKLFLPRKIILFYQRLFEEKYNPETTRKIKELIQEFLTIQDTKRQINIAQEITQQLEKQSAQINSGRIILDMKIGNVNGINGKGGYSKQQKKAIQELTEALKQQIKEAIENLDDKEKSLLKKIIEKRKRAEKKEKEWDNNKRAIGNKADELTNKERKRLDKKNEFNKEVDKRRKSQKPEEQTQKEKDLLKELENIDEEIKKTRTENKQLTEESNKNQEELKKELEELSTLSNELSEEINDETTNDEEDIEEETIQDTKAIYQGENTEIGAGVGTTTTELRGTTPFTPSTHHRLIAKQLARTINKIQNDTSRGYIQRQETGEINTDRAMNFKKTGDLKIFDKYAPNDTKATRIGVVILLDSSSSMTQANFQPALETSWTINEAIKTTKNKTIIIEYSNDYKIIKNFNDKKGDFKRHFHDGTTISPALREAQKQIRIATKREKIQNWIIYILTDGEWVDEITAEKTIKEINTNKNTITHLIHYLSKTSTINEEAIRQHGCNHKTVIKGDIQQLEPILRKTLTKIALNIRTKLNKNKGV
jgi:uncharacterized protein YegL